MREAIQQLLDIVDGIVADDDLHNLEIEFLKEWLGAHRDVANVWPGFAITKAIDAVLADGHVSEAERSYLMATLKQLASGEFSFDNFDGNDGLALPLDNVIELRLRDSLVCLAGDFLHGTKSACERLLEHAGAWPTGTVDRNVRYLVIGARASSSLLQVHVGEKIKDALALQQAGHKIAIVSERRWLECLA